MFSLLHLVSNWSGLQTLNRGSLGPFCRVLAFSTASCLQLAWSPNSHSGVPRPLLPGTGFLNHILTPAGLVSKLTDFLYSRSYIIVQRPPFCGRHNRTHSTRPRSRLYSDICWADAPVIYIGAFLILTVRPGRRSIYNTFCLPSIVSAVTGCGN